MIAVALWAINQNLDRLIQLQQPGQIKTVNNKLEDIQELGMKIPVGTRIKLTVRTGSELINLEGTVTEDQVPFNTYAAAYVQTLDYKPCGLISCMRKQFVRQRSSLYPTSRQLVVRLRQLKSVTTTSTPTATTVPTAGASCAASLQALKSIHLSHICKVVILTC